MVDGPGPVPDSLAEVFFVFLAVLVFLGVSFFTSLDGQLAFAVSNPGEYFGLGNGSFDGETITLSESQVDSLNFATKNRIGFDDVGNEIGFCGGLTSDGEVFDLRVADILSSSRDSVSFSCGSPRDVAFHSQPFYSSGFSVEDLSFDGEFKPRVSCIVFGEVLVSPVSGEVSGLNCVDTVTGDSVGVVSSG